MAMSRCRQPFRMQRRAAGHEIPSQEVARVVASTSAPSPAQADNVQHDNGPVAPPDVSQRSRRSRRRRRNRGKHGRAGQVKSDINTKEVLNKLESDVADDGAGLGALTEAPIKTSATTTPPHFGWLPWHDELRHDRGAPLTFPGDFDEQHWHAGSFHAVFWDVEHPVEYFIHRATGVTWAKLVWAFPDRWPGIIDVEDPPGYWFRFTAWANVSGRAAYEDIDPSVYFGHVAFREAFLQYARPPYSVPGNSEEYRQHEQKYGRVGFDLEDDAQLVAMAEYSVRRVLQVMAWLWETYEESTLDYVTMCARRCPLARGYWGELEMEDNFMAYVHMAACRAIVEAWMIMPLAKAKWFGGAGGAAQLQRCEFMGWEFEG